MFEHHYMGRKEYRDIWLALEVEGYALLAVGRDTIAQLMDSH